MCELWSRWVLLAGQRRTSQRYVQSNYCALAAKRLSNAGCYRVIFALLMYDIAEVMLSGLFAVCALLAKLWVLSLS